MYRIMQSICSPIPIRQGHFHFNMVAAHDVGTGWRHLLDYYEFLAVCRASFNIGGVLCSCFITCVPFVFFLSRFPFSSFFIFFVYIS